MLPLEPSGAAAAVGGQLEDRRSVGAHVQHLRERPPGHAIPGQRPGRVVDPLSAVRVGAIPSRAGKPGQGRHPGDTTGPPTFGRRLEVDDVNVGKRVLGRGDRSDDVVQRQVKGAGCQRDRGRSGRRGPRPGCGEDGCRLVTRTPPDRDDGDDRCRPHRGRDRRCPPQAADRSGGRPRGRRGQRCRGGLDAPRLDQSRQGRLGRPNALGGRRPPQPPDRSADPLAGPVLGHTEGEPDLGERPPLVEPEQDRLPVGPSQAADGVVQHRNQSGPRRLARGRRHGRRHGGRLVSPTTGTVPHDSGRRVPQDAEQPSGHAPLARGATGRQGREHGLRHVPGRVVVADPPTGGRVHPVDVSGDQFGERVGRPGTVPVQQLMVRG